MIMSLPSLVRGIAALGLLALAACNNDPENGSLTITYSFAPGVSCNENQELVEEIRVDIGEGGMTATQTAPCENAGGELVLASVAAGNYDLFVLGLDDEGDAVLDNLGGAPSDARIEIIGGDPAEKAVVLGLAPARLEVALVVNNDGFPAQCSSSEIMVKGVRAEAWDFNSSELLKSHEFDLCDFDGFEAVPDMEREINGRRFDGVVIQPIDASGNAVGDSYDFPFGGPVGAGKLARVSVECEGEECNVQLLEGDPGTPPDPTTGEESSTGGSTGGDTTGGSGSGGADSTTG